MSALKENVDYTADSTTGTIEFATMTNFTAGKIALESHGDLLEALEAAEARDESAISFADLECFTDDAETHKEYSAEYHRRRRQRAALKKAKP